jgi:UDP-N-acetyl-2-amino-2-deoxyglucuronate dehydrogenase
MHKLRFGIIGCGVIGPLHAHAISELPNAKLVAVCDIDRSRAEAMAAKYGAAHILTHYPDLLARRDIDAVCICTPHYLHAEMAIAAARAGKHILCEKPMAIRSADMDAMIAETDRAGVQLGICFQHRFSPVFIQLKALVESGKLGRPLLGAAQLRCLRDKAYYQSAAWRGTWAREGGGVLINQAIHTIDLMLWMLGDVASVTGACATLCGREYLEVEDTASAVITFAGGAQGTIAATTASHLGWQSRLQIYGTNGSAEINYGPPQDFATLQIGSETHPLTFEEEADPAEGKRCYGNSHTRAVANFTDCVLEKRPFPINGHEGRKAVELILSLYRSSGINAT